MHRISNCGKIKMYEIHEILHIGCDEGIVDFTTRIIRSQEDGHRKIVEYTVVV